MTEKIKHKIVEALVAAENSSDAIAAIWSIKKKAQPNWSLAYACRKAGITSRGYLSDVVRGRRVLNLKYVDTLGEELDLGLFEIDTFRVLVKIDSTKNVETKQRLREDLVHYKKILKIHFRHLPASEVDMVVVGQVFAAFGIFAKEATRRQILDVFPKKERASVESALDYLIVQKLLHSDGRYLRVTEEGVMMEPNSPEVLSYILSCYQQSAGKVETWFHKTEQALMQSIAISVNRRQYMEELQALKRDFYKRLASLESNEADTVVQFNLSAFPVR